MQHPPQSPDNGLLFALSAIEEEMRSESAYRQHGHAARTLVKTPGLRVVLGTAPWQWARPTRPTR